MFFQFSHYFTFEESFIIQPRFENIRYYTIFLLFLILSIHVNGQSCLRVFTNSRSGDNLFFNPVWIKNNGIKKIVEREYIDKDTSKLGLVNYLYFDSAGYISKIINGSRDPKTTYPPEDENFSIFYYKYKWIDSFLCSEETIIRQFNEHGHLTTPDTILQKSRQYYNVFNLKNRVEDQIPVETYHFDKNGNLVLLDEPPVRKTIFKYQNGDPVYIEQNYSKEFKYIMDFSKRWFTYDEKKRVVETSATNGFLHMFSYGTNNEMIIRKDFHNGKYQGRYTYEYIKR